MPYLWVLLLLAVLYYDTLRRVGLDNKSLKCRYLLYQLRDELRETAMTGETDAKNWVFLYLDSSVAKTISLLDKLTVWHALFVYLAYRKDAKLLRVSEQLERELRKPGNAALKRVHERYENILTNYLIKRHPVALGLFLSQAITYVVVTAYFKQKVEGLKVRWSRAVEMLTEAPETSTLYKFSS